MKVVVAAFNQEKALVGAFSMISNLRMDLFEALSSSEEAAGRGGLLCSCPPPGCCPQMKLPGRELLVRLGKLYLFWIIVLFPPRQARILSLRLESVYFIWLLKGKHDIMVYCIIQWRSRSWIMCAGEHEFVFSVKLFCWLFLWNVDDIKFHFPGYYESLFCGFEEQKIASSSINLKAKGKRCKIYLYEWVANMIWYKYSLAGLQPAARSQHLPRYPTSNWLWLLQEARLLT